MSHDRTGVQYGTCRRELERACWSRLEPVGAGRKPAETASEYSAGPGPCNWTAEVCQLDFTTRDAALQPERETETHTAMSSFTHSGSHRTLWNQSCVMKHPRSEAGETGPSVSVSRKTVTQSKPFQQRPDIHGTF